MSEIRKFVAPLPPGALQAYSDAFRATRPRGGELEAHIAGLRAAIDAALRGAPLKDTAA